VGTPWGGGERRGGREIRGSSKKKKGEREKKRLDMPDLKRIRKQLSSRWQKLRGRSGYKRSCKKKGVTKTMGLRGEG